MAVPMKRASKTQPAQAAKRRVPTTHLGVDCCFADVEIKHSSKISYKDALFHPMFVARMIMAGDKKRESAIPEENK